MEDSTLEEEFNRRVKALNERAKSAGTNITELCRLAGVSRTTPERWTKRVPQSISIFDSIFLALVNIEKTREQEEEAFNNLPAREQERIKTQQQEREREKEKERRSQRNAARRLNRARQKNTPQD